MKMLRPMKTIEYSSDAWKLLNGIVCLYKPSFISSREVKRRVALNLSHDLNRMKRQSEDAYLNSDRLSISGSNCSSKLNLLDSSVKDDLQRTNVTSDLNSFDSTGKESLLVNVSSNFNDVLEEESKLHINSLKDYASHPLLLGSGMKYNVDDFNVYNSNHLNFNMSGVMLIGINNGISTLKRFQLSQPIKVYHIKGEFGYSTDTGLPTGKVVEKSYFKHISMGRFEKFLNSVELSHQRTMFSHMGVSRSSQEAYEQIIKGPVRPAKNSPCLIYSVKCIYFKRPHFTIEVSCVNESWAYFVQLISDIGIRLKTNAVCHSVRNVRYGFFNIDHSLLIKNWHINEIINNMIHCNKLINANETKISANLIHFKDKKL